MSSDTYTESSTPGKVVEGTIISMREVTIKEHDKLQDNKAGGLAGAAVGGIAGASAIGSGWGQAGAGLGGALIGAVAGALIEDAVETQKGTEYLVKLKNPPAEPVKTTKHINEKGSQPVEDELKAGIAVSTQSDIVSVVQKTDPQLQAGSLVYIIYSDDRPRLIPRKE